MPTRLADFDGATPRDGFDNINESGAFLSLNSDHPAKTGAQFLRAKVPASGGGTRFCRCIWDFGGDGRPVTGPAPGDRLNLIVYLWLPANYPTLNNVTLWRLDNYGSQRPEVTGKPDNRSYLKLEWINGRLRIALQHLNYEGHSPNWPIHQLPTLTKERWHRIGYRATLGDLTTARNNLYINGKAVETGKRGRNIFDPYDRFRIGAPALPEEGNVGFQHDFDHVELGW